VAADRSQARSEPGRSASQGGYALDETAGSDHHLLTPVGARRTVSSYGFSIPPRFALEADLPRGTRFRVGARIPSGASFRERTIQVRAITLRPGHCAERTGPYR